jgi:hypothetical protein
LCVFTVVQRRRPNLRGENIEWSIIPFPISASRHLMLLSLSILALQTLNTIRVTNKKRGHKLHNNKEGCYRILW